MPQLLAQKLTTRNLQMYEIENKNIWVTGHNGMVGRAVCDVLSKKGAKLITATRQTLDLRNQSDVETWLASNKIDAVIMCAARVGGILANDNAPAEFIYDNLTMATNVIHAASRHQVEKLLFLGSSCIYPRIVSQPIREDSLLTGSLEPTNEYYALAKIAGIKLCQAYRKQYGHDYISVMPTNLYGPFDNFDLKSSHVLPALLKKAHAAKMSGSDNFEVWGSGQARREFLHVSDCAAGIVFLLENYSELEPVNLGYGKDVTIEELALLIKNTVGFKGGLVFDRSKPDGTPRKLLDISKITAMGWHPKIDLRSGLQSTYDFFKTAERAR